MKFHYSIEWRNCDDKGFINSHSKKIIASFEDTEDVLKEIPVKKGQEKKYKKMHGISADIQAYIFATHLMDYVSFAKVSLEEFNGSSLKWNVKYIEDIIKKQHYLYEDFINEEFEKLKEDDYDIFVKEYEDNIETYAVSFLDYFKKSSIQRELNNVTGPNKSFLRIYNKDNSKFILDTTGLHFD